MKIIMNVERTCPFCRKRTRLFVDMIQYSCWLEGMNIQDAMPELSRVERETLISGLCEDCINEMSNIKEDE